MFALEQRTVLWKHSYLERLAVPADGRLVEADEQRRARHAPTASVLHRRRRQRVDAVRSAGVQRQLVMTRVERHLYNNDKPRLT